MKIVTWNCNQKFRESFREIIKENADIYVIQECEDPSRSKVDEYKEFASNHYWVGDNVNKGLGVFARENVKIELAGLEDNGLRYFIPLKVNDTFNLLGIWTNPNVKYPVAEYPNEITRYYELHKESGFFNEDLIMCGDFNCDARLKGAHAKNVFKMIKKMSEIDLVDIYHYLTGESEGEESKSTFFMYRHLDKPYHLDHVFASKDMVKRLEVKNPSHWLEFSDHVPIIFEVEK
ncbi:MAG: endonuclease/exonuclease/phosphatase family protein [Methanobrevibacter sp.]|nr:endonuclease/exonuclease/phosphatase family protein [Methanobrevibacter sp.]